ncbi:FAD/NAD(P)-binding domain-containing protein [Cadophora sp. DSE1049]|nr:FAD/NAD(P)-binding domain-containing protein [Cadophora sp. DSE1049]
MGSIALPTVEELHVKDTSFDVPTAPYPRISDAPLPSSPEEIQSIVDQSITALNTTLQSRDYASLSDLMAKTSYWRDHLGLSPTKLSTLYGSDQIISLITYEGKTNGNKCNITSLSLTGTPELTNLDPKGTIKCILATLSFTTPHGIGKGISRWILDDKSDSQWRIYTLFTSLTDLTATPFQTGSSRPENAKPESAPPEMNWYEWKERQHEFLDGEEPTVLIVGAGHSGLMTAARLKMLGVRTLVVDKGERTGDCWRKRYHDLVLHDPCWMNALPYLRYPPSWPILTPKDKMADFLASYETALDLDVWNSTQVVESKWNAVKKEWTIVLERNQDGTITRRIFHPHHIVQATGLNGEPRIPTIPGMETFTGTTLHSTQFNNPSTFANRKVIVVGTGTSGHDIAQGLHRHGASVTIVQRSPTFVLTLSSVHKMVRVAYNETTDVEDADLKMLSLPTTLFKHVGSDASAMLAPLNQETWDGLERAGFKTISKPLEQELPSLLSLTIQRAGGFYIDVGCSPLISSGAVRVKSSPSISHFTGRGMVFADGEEVQADVVVFATGYSNGRVRTRRIFGDEVADRVDPVWGFDGQGEVRGVWKRGGQEGFWVAAGSFWLSRYYSRLLALQIKMIEEGLVGL